MITFTGMCSAFFTASTMNPPFLKPTDHSVAGSRTSINEIGTQLNALSTAPSPNLHSSRSSLLGIQSRFNAVDAALQKHDGSPEYCSFPAAQKGCIDTVCCLHSVCKKQTDTTHSIPPIPVRSTLSIAPTPMDPFAPGKRKPTQASSLPGNRPFGVRRHACFVPRFSPEFSSCRHL